MQTRTAMGRATLPRLVAAMVGLALLTAACGSDDDDEGSTATDAPEAVDTTAPAPVPTEPESTTTAAAPPSAPGTEPTTTASPTDALAPEPLAEETVVKVGLVARAAPFAGVIVGEALGEFEKENIKIEYIDLPPADVLLQLNQGEIDVSPNTLSAGMLNAIDQGFELRLIAPVYHGVGETLTGIFIRPEFVDNPEGLRGQRFTANSGAASGNVLEMGQYLESVGLTINDVVVDALPSDAVAAAFAQKEIAGSYVTAPRYQAIVDAGDAVSVWPARDGSTVAGLVAGSGLLDRPDVAQAFVRAYARTYRDHLQGDYLADDAVVGALADHLSVEPDVVRSTPAYEFDANLGMPTEAFETLQGYYIQLGSAEFDEPLAVDQVFDSSFIHALGLTG
jgi:NitT/TauT family transport system substrate-binding protein